MSGLFITFEGGEGAGKSTQARVLAEHLGQRGREVILTEEPRGTDFGQGVWQLLARGVAPQSELFLFAAARAHHVANLIGPALESGAVVVCDRFSDSTIAYQQYGRGLDGELVRRVCAYAEGGVVPDLTFLMDLPPDVGLLRKAEAAEDDAIGSASAEFHERVRQGYLTLAGEYPVRIRVIDATLPPEDIAGRVQRAVSHPMASHAADGLASGGCPDDPAPPSGAP